ncbi:hypothetical protein EVAR_97155_1 [Eumeta japonica]|uniref:Uncharacterized protein n=1 Tax=Eumeta variegata TaxID=151549 RepID=A0A4C1XUF4_EUMVA|nr:hypothetical protein EVAR_97155_1 [Eumeta japonica]
MPISRNCGAFVTNFTAAGFRALYCSRIPAAFLHSRLLRGAFALPRRPTVDKTIHVLVVCGRCLSSTRTPAVGVEERSLAPRSRSRARLRRNATMSHAFSCVQPAAFIDL